jgi:hypothetical protein
LPCTTTYTAAAATAAKGVNMPLAYLLAQLLVNQVVAGTLVQVATVEQLSNLQDTHKQSSATHRTSNITKCVL